MDDKEYYSLMNKNISAKLLEDLLKTKKNKKASESKVIEWQREQVREDTEMLEEKKNFFNESED